MLLSIIIPVYNSEKHLLKCIESVINQTLKDIEIICINDGSKDASLKILEEYAKKDDRIIVINQKNQGVSAARNDGMTIAKGEFVAFMDSDDYYPTNDILEVLYKKAKENNVLICGGSFSEVYFGETITDFSEINEKYVFKKDEKIKYCDYQFDFGFHRFIYNLEFLKKENIIFPNYTYFEDPVFFIKTLFAAKEFYAVNKVVYAYRLKKTYKIKNKQQVLDLFLAMEEMLKFTKQNKLSELHNLLYMRLNDYITLHCYEHISVFNLKIIKTLKKILSGINYDYVKKDLQLDKAVKRAIKNNILSLRNYENKKCISFLGFHWYFNLKISKKDYKDYKKFNTQKIQQNRVLVIEGNECHGEVLPGYIKYIKELGYDIDLITTRTLKEENPFAKIPNGLINNTYFFVPYSLKTILHSKNIKNYEHILLTSNYVYYDKDEKGWPTLFEYTNGITQPKNNIIIVEHHGENVKNITEGKPVVLADFHSEDMKMAKVVNPHHFGDVKITDKSDLTNFVMVGGIQAFRRNSDLLINSVYELYIQEIKNFKVTVIGKGSLIGIPEEIHDFFDIKGRLTYEAMFDEIEKADFILPLLDPENPDHERYITTGTSGSFQLIYGFRKPCLINRKFAPLHGFNNENSIVYEQNKDLTQAMITAINMSKEEYKTKQDRIALYADNLYKQSLENMKELLNG